MIALHRLWWESKVGHDMAMSSPSEPSGQVAKLLYELAVSNLQQQRASLDEMRSRAGALLSASSISNAFLGAVAARGTGAFHLPLRFWTALGPFILSVILCISVLWYTDNWEFSLRSDMLGNTIPPDMSLQQTYYQLASKLESMNDNNETGIKYRSWIFAAAAIATVVAIGAWLFLIE